MAIVPLNQPVPTPTVNVVYVTGHGGGSGRPGADFPAWNVTGTWTSTGASATIVVPANGTLDIIWAFQGLQSGSFGSGPNGYRILVTGPSAYSQIGAIMGTSSPAGGRGPILWSASGLAAGTYTFDCQYFYTLGTTPAVTCQPTTQATTSIPQSYEVVARASG